MPQKLLIYLDTQTPDGGRGLDKRRRRKVKILIVINEPVMRWGKGVLPTREFQRERQFDIYKFLSQQKLRLSAKTIYSFLQLSVILHIFFWRQVFFAKILQLGGSGMKWKLCRVVFTAASILSPPSSPIFLSKLITRTRNCLPRDFERRKLLMIWKKSSSTRNMKDITKVLHFKNVLDIDKVLYITKMWATLPERRRLSPNYTRQ